jgi:lactoylglutathione lyase
VKHLTKKISVFAILALLLAVSIARPSFFSAAFSQPAQPQRPLIIGIAHIAFQVSDLKKAQEFYGEMLGYEEAFQIQNDGSLLLTCFKVNERQYIEIYPNLPASAEDRLSHIAFETTDLEALRVYLQSRGVRVPDKIMRGREGNANFQINDPDGHPIEFVQYLPESLHSRAKGRYISTRRISDRILHAGLTISDPVAANKFYQDVLGFSEIWRGGRTDEVTDWINVKVPDGTDYLEYMLIREKPNRERLGSLHHVALLVPDIQKALETIRQRPHADDAKFVRSPQIGRNRRWQLNLFDADGTRTELMEPFTVR